MKQVLQELLRFASGVLLPTDEHQLLQSACDMLVSSDSFRFAWIGYPQNDSQETVKPVAQSGSSDAILLKPHDPTRKCIATGQSSRSNLVLAVPLKTDGQTFAALTLHARSADQLNEENGVLLEEWANLLAQGVIAARHEAIRLTVRTAFSRKDIIRNILQQCVNAFVQLLDA